MYLKQMQLSFSQRSLSMSSSFPENQDPASELPSYPAPGKAGEEQAKTPSSTLAK
jgi:hypothetical protein